MDARVAVCPSCGATLKKVPGGKTKCPACCEYIYVRTDLRNRRVVVTHEQAEEIDDEWSRVNGTWDQRSANKDRVEEARAALKEKFGQDFSNSDVLWRFGSNDMIEHAKQRQWGLYRNDLYEIADVARRDDDYEKALLLFLDINYIDTNGPNNVGLWIDGSPVVGEEDWQIAMGFLAPVPLGYVKSLPLRLGKTVAESLSEYETRAENLQRVLRFPLDWRSSRVVIEEALNRQ
jgi:uncharacterized Zn finger protein (UPF0148 family)